MFFLAGLGDNGQAFEIETVMGPPAAGPDPVPAMTGLFAPPTGPGALATPLYGGLPHGGTWSPPPMPGVMPAAALPTTGSASPFPVETGLPGGSAPNAPPRASRNDAWGAGAPVPGWWPAAVPAPRSSMGWAIFGAVGFAIARSVLR